MAARKKPADSTIKRSPTDKATLAKIQRLAQGALRMVTKGDNPTLSIRMRALSNVSFNEKKRIIELGDKAQQREFFNTAMARKVHADVPHCERLQDPHRRGQDRQHPSDVLHDEAHAARHAARTPSRSRRRATPSSRTSRSASTRCARSCTCSRTSSGIVAGQLVVNDAGDRIDLSRMGRGGWGIPSICEPSVLKFVKSQAEFILLVEKARRMVTASTRTGSGRSTSASS